ncbi:MAG: inositol monophosphatase [Phycisphaerae bacterium]|jgi:myo-inositol-1(or 4)-monophosphatase
MSIDNKDLKGLLEAAVVAARAAGQRAMENINYAKAYAKTPSEIVTDCDVRCQQIIIDTIKQNFSDHGFIGEEGNAGKIFKQAPRGDSDIWWVIDPIDGTNNFAHKILNFAVSIAAIQNGRPILGVIFEPSTDSMFTVVKDSSPRFNDTSVQVSDNDLEIFETIGIESVFTQGVPAWIPVFMSKLRCRSLGTTAMHLAYVAKGSFVGTICNKPKLWDIAAGTILVESAGGIVSDWQGNAVWPIDMNSYQGQTIEIIASNKKVHKKLIDIINAK